MTQMLDADGVEMPYKVTEIDFSDLGSGATDTINLQSPPANSIIKAVVADIKTAWTVGGGDTTGLNLEVGDAADPNGLLTALNLVGASAGKTLLGGAGAELSGVALEASAPTFQALFTATGGSTELDHVDAGRILIKIYWMPVS